MEIRGYLFAWRERVDATLDALLPPESTYPPSLYKAMRYSVFAGGKRLRPILAIAAHEAVGGDGTRILPYSCALELVHTYSLIHDDLPAMDDDDFRRGKPTNHRVFGEGIAILAGDALLTEAFALMVRPDITDGRSDAMVLSIIRELADASGMKGMVGGQVVDLESAGQTVSFETVEWIHAHKTMALIVASVRMGGLLGAADDPQMEALTRYGEGIGLAFQIVDDILDIEGTTEELGKEVGADHEHGKVTFPAFLGVDASKEKAQKAIDEAVDGLSLFDRRADPLRGIARFIIERRT